MQDEKTKAEEMTKPEWIGFIRKQMEKAATRPMSEVELGGEMVTIDLALTKEGRQQLGAEWSEESVELMREDIQKRGAWHFNLLLFVSPSFGKLKELCHFVASSWYELCGKLCEGHLQAGTHVEEVKSWSRATSYMEKYVAKPEQFPEGVETGRVWGTWNPELLPVRWETVEVSLKDAYRIRRIYRKLAKMREGTSAPADGICTARERGQAA